MPRSPRLVRGGLVALGAFVGVAVLEHALRPDLPPADHFLSEYGRGSTQYLQSAGFLAWAGSMAAGAVVAARLPARGRGAGTGRAVATAALAAATGGAVLCALFATQTVAGKLPDGVARTTAGRLHDLGTLFILAGLVLAAVAALALVRERRYGWQVAGLAVTLVAIVPVLVALGIDAPGWGQRGFILVGCAWQACFFLASVRAFPTPSRPAPRAVAP